MPSLFSELDELKKEEAALPRPEELTPQQKAELDLRAKQVKEERNRKQERWDKSRFEN